jgi:hypothetical protein
MYHIPRTSQARALCDNTEITSWTTHLTADMLVQGVAFLFSIKECTCSKSAHSITNLKILVIFSQSLHSNATTVPTIGHEELLPYTF